jgi:ABC-type nickel/cobalt efflux system permease component RcnA
VLGVLLMLETIGWLALIVAASAVGLALLAVAVVNIVRWLARRRDERAELAKLAAIVRAADLGIAELYGSTGRTP